MTFFAFGIYPLITYLERRLVLILITSIPVLGPPNLLGEITPNEERYKVISYAEDPKPAVTSIQEIGNACG